MVHQDNSVCKGECLPTGRPLTPSRVPRCQGATWGGRGKGMWSRRWADGSTELRPPSPAGQRAWVTWGHCGRCALTFQAHATKVKSRLHYNTVSYQNPSESRKVAVPSPVWFCKLPSREGRCTGGHPEEAEDGRSPRGSQGVQAKARTQRPGAEPSRVPSHRVTGPGLRFLILDMGGLDQQGLP